MPMFRRKGVVQARRLVKDLAEDIADWCGGLLVTEIDPEDPSKTFVGVNVPTKEGVARASQGDWIIQGEHGDFWPLSDPEFSEIYEHDLADA